MAYCVTFSSRPQIFIVSSLTDNKKRRLRGLGTKLKPVVIIGIAGDTQAVCNELDLALSHHELLKVQVKADEQ